MRLVLSAMQKTSAVRADLHFVGRGTVYGGGPNNKPQLFVLSNAQGGRMEYRKIEYRCETTSLIGFVQILASNYLPHGYWFYVTGRVPAGKDARLVDQKILAKYGIALSRQQRARRKAVGQANLHYVRYQDFFVILATHGRHPFFAEEGTALRDIRKVPLQVGGYSIWVKRGDFLKRESADEVPVPDHRHRVRVLISRGEYRLLRDRLLDLATHRTAERLRAEFWSVRFEPYAPVRKQLLRILRLVNARRLAMGYERVPTDALRLRRRIVKPFGEVRVNKEAADWRAGDTVLPSNTAGGLTVALLPEAALSAS
jgi:hypothetical protein